MRMYVWLFNKSTILSNSNRVEIVVKQILSFFFHMHFSIHFGCGESEMWFRRSFVLCVCGHSNVFSVARVSSQSIHKPSHCLCVDLKNYTCKHLTAFFVDSFDRLLGAFISFVQLKTLSHLSPSFFLASVFSTLLPHLFYLASPFFHFFIFFASFECFCTSFNTPTRFALKCIHLLRYLCEICLWLLTVI